MGYLHRDRPGRESLPLDLMEELRPCLADRFVLTLVNNRVLQAEDFTFRESGAVLLTDGGRRTFLQKWQERKRETITHPFLEEKMPWGLVPWVQSLLLARYLRGDLEEYPPFLWKRGVKMLVLITYDVNAEDAAGKSACGRSPSSASATDKGCRIPPLNAFWTRPSAAACSTSSARSWMRSGTACGSIILETSMKAASSISAASRPTSRRTR